MCSDICPQRRIETGQIRTDSPGTASPLNVSPKASITVTAVPECKNGRETIRTIRRDLDAISSYLATSICR
jgi:hypothetical protein